MEMFVGGKSGKSNKCDIFYYILIEGLDNMCFIVDIVDVIILKIMKYFADLATTNNYIMQISSVEISLKAKNEITYNILIVQYHINTAINVFFCFQIFYSRRYQYISIRKYITYYYQQNV